MLWEGDKSGYCFVKASFHILEGDPERTVSLNMISNSAVLPKACFFFLILLGKFGGVKSSPWTSSRRGDSSWPVDVCCVVQLKKS